MTIEQRPSGILVPSQRSLGPPPPLEEPPRGDVTPNDNPAEGSVGPNVPIGGSLSAQEGEAAGYGATHVLYNGAYPPLEASAWAGWPSNWATPNTNSVGGSWHVDADIVFACVQQNATAVADMPVIVSKNRVQQPAPSWLTNPNPMVYSHWGEFFRQVWWSYQAIGEAFIVATSRFADGFPRTFMMLDPWLVNAEIKDGIRTYSINGIDATADVCHVRYFSWPGDARGHGPLEAARERILAAKVFMRYGADLAANGGIPWAVLKSKYRLTPDQAQKLKEQWISSARSRMGAPAILDQELELEPIQVTPTNMALSEQQKFAEARIAVLLGVPPYLVGLPTGSDSQTYSNINMLFDYWWRISLRPNGQYILKALSEWALPGHVDLLLNSSAYTQPGPQERAQYYAMMRSIEALTIEEIREAEGLNPLTSSVPAEGTQSDSSQPVAVPVALG